MKKLISLSLAALCLIGCAAGCGKKDDESESKKKESQFVGKWECSEMSFGGTTMENFMGIPVAAMLQAEVTDDGKFTMNSALSDGDADNQTGEWKEIDENTIEVTVEADGEKETLELEFKDDKLVMSEDMGNGMGNAEVTFIKVDKFTEFSEEDLKGNLDFGDIGLDTDLDDADWDINE